LVIAAVGLSHYVATVPAVAHLLLVEPFRVNLTIVAAVLTVLSYSMIDTIVVFDRIRENRGKFGHLSRQIVNDSINQTLSRTLLTAGT
ncbi:protein translocase subunit SecF, partial [Acinetobacter baumannii]|nr:protein translocase subunit SecF [Acinetobacter baumannii]